MVEGDIVDDSTCVVDETIMLVEVEVGKTVEVPDGKKYSIFKPITKTYYSMTINVVQRHGHGVM